MLALISFVQVFEVFLPLPIVHLLSYCLISSADDLVSISALLLVFICLFPCYILFQLRLDSIQQSFFCLVLNYQIICILYGIDLPASHCEVSDVLAFFLDEPISIEMEQNRRYAASPSDFNIVGLSLVSQIPSGSCISSISVRPVDLYRLEQFHKFTPVGSVERLLPVDETRANVLIDIETSF
uniref:Putative product n=1 Tax=Xenopsylla cheopis TaxID=163159 RepID=A0A6M2E0K1_XENCH